MALLWTIAGTIFLILSTVETNDAAKKIVFLPMAVGSSPYFLFLRLAEEVESRGYNVSFLP